MASGRRASGRLLLVDRESRDRAIGPAALVPDARFSATEVWPLMDTGGTEM